jgi:predicted methyltransferase
MALAMSIFVGCAATSTPNYDAILTNMSRPEAERAIDPVRKPQEVMAFYEVKTGQRVADIFASRGYYTAILSQLVGAEGVVYAANQAARPELHEREAGEHGECADHRRPVRQDCLAAGWFARLRAAPSRLS